MRVKKEIICGIYKITSPSGKIYIGQSVNCNIRKSRYKQGAPKQGRLNASIKKYGWDLHKFEVIHLCDESELNKWEIYYGESFDCRNKEKGLNIKECGGSKGRHSEETILKCRLSKLGKKNTPEHVKNVRNARIKLIEEGKYQTWNKGLQGVQKCSEETKEKRRNKMLVLKRPESHRINCKLRFQREKEIRLKNGDPEKITTQAKIVLHLQTGIFYESAKSASKTYNIAYRTLIAKLNGSNKNKTSLMYI